MEGITRTTAKGLLGTAEQYLIGYKIITKDYPDRNYLSPNLGLWKPRYYLLGHCLELVFKVFLLKKGVSLDYLKKQIVHDLEKCLTLSGQKGLSIFDKQEKATVRALNIYYSSKDFEYQQIGFKSLPYLGDVEKLLEKLIVKVKAEAEVI